MTPAIKAEPVTIAIPDEVLIDLKERIAQTRWPIEAKAPAWTYGTSLTYLRGVADYWLNHYDWRKSEAALNRFPNYKTEIGRKQIHFILERGSGANPLPLILTHGWPGSVVEFLDVIEPLAHPERFGGNPDDGFTVVVPSLPGYGFSDPPDAPIAPRDIAATWSKLMTDILGFDRYVAQGGDWGGIVTSWLALDHPARLQAIHLNIVGFNPQITDDDPLTAEEENWQQRHAARRDGETAYHAMNGTKPQTLSYGLTDSPIGLAAWILEKFHGWTVPGRDVEPPFDRDHLLANVMLYWLNGSNAAAWLYKSLIDGSGRSLPKGGFVDIPTAVLLFPDDIAVPPPDRWIERSYNLAQRHDAPSGGHFAAFENGPLFVEDVRAFFRAFR